jgi:hypothetical protein
MRLKPVYLLIYGVLLTCSAEAQLQVKYFETPGVFFRKPVIAGRISDRYLIIDQPDSAGTPAYIYDSAFKLVDSTRLPARAYSAAYGNSDSNVYFVWQERRRESFFALHMLVDSLGNYTLQSDSIPSAQALNGYRYIIPDKLGKFFLFYSALTDKERHLVINGALYDSAFRQVKTFRKYVDYDPALERLAMPLVDSRGNVHFTVYDKLTNYRLSGHMRMHTLALDSTNITIEPFEFDKVKFYDLIFFDNPALKQVELAGFYYDGGTKVKEGLASIRFSYTRKGGHTAKFIPFTSAQREELRKGMKWVRGKNDITDFLKLRDIIEEDGHVYVTGWLVNISPRQLVKDNQGEELSNVDYMRWFSPEVFLQYGLFSNPVGAVGRFPSGVGSLNDISAFNGLQAYSMPGGGSYIARSFNGVPIGTQQRSFSSGQGLQPVKLSSKAVFFHMGPESDSSWQQVLGDSVLLSSVSYQPGLWHYPLVENGRLYFLLPPLLTPKNGKPARLLHITEQEMVTAALPPNWQEPFYLSRPLKLAEKKYLALYRNGPSEGNGLALLSLQ